MTPATPDRALHTVLGWTVFTFTFPWLTFVASLARADYEWAGFGLAGRGTSGSFGWLAAVVAYGGVVLYLGWRGARRAFQALVLLWHLALFGALLYGAWRWGDDMVFHGAAFGIVVPLAWIGPLLSGGIVVATVSWLLRDLRAPAPPLPPRSWRHLDQRSLWLAVMLAPLAVVCFRSGPVDGTGAKLGVLVSVVQWIAIASALGASLPSRAELREQRLLKEALRAQLQALQARTQPHFLFNTLNTVAGLIEEDPRRAEEVVTRLSDLYRHVLGRAERERVRLEEELAAVSAYLEIEAVRFGERLRWQLAVEPGLDDVPLLPFVLQPLVENAVLHGVGERREGGEVRVRVARGGKGLRLEVEDDGPGEGGSLWRAGSGTALADLAERLRLAYGEAAGVTRDRGPLGGFRVSVSVPLELAVEEGR